MKTHFYKEPGARTNEVYHLLRSVRAGHPLSVGNLTIVPLAVPSLAGQVGAAVLHGADAIALDVFGSADLYRKCHRKLLRGAFAELRNLARGARWMCLRRRFARRGAVPRDDRAVLRHGFASLRRSWFRTRRCSPFGGARPDPRLLAWAGLSGGGERLNQKIMLAAEGITLEEYYRSHRPFVRHV